MDEPESRVLPAKLVQGGLLALQAQGRQRYFRLASPQVADITPEGGAAFGRFFA